MPKFKIKGVTVSVRKGSARVGSIPAEADGKVNGKQGKGLTVRVNRKTPQEEINDLHREQGEALCKRIAKLENTWYRRAWRFLNKPIGVLPWQN